MGINDVIEWAEQPQKVSRLGKFGWAAYQLASDPYFVMVNIFVFAPYFEGTIVGDYFTQRLEVVLLVHGLSSRPGIDTLPQIHWG